MDWSTFTEILGTLGGIILWYMVVNALAHLIEFLKTATARLQNERKY